MHDEMFYCFFHSAYVAISVVMFPDDVEVMVEFAFLESHLVAMTSLCRLLFVYLMFREANGSIVLYSRPLLESDHFCCQMRFMYSSMRLFASLTVIGMECQHGRGLSLSLPPRR